MPLGTEVGLGPGHIVLDGDPALPLPPKWGGSKDPQFSAQLYCDQTTRWINKPLGTEVGHGPCHIVLHGDPHPPPKGHTPIFGLSVVAVISLDGPRYHLVRT